MPEIPASRPLIAAYLVPSFAAALWAGIMGLASSETLDTQRSLIFLGGPLLMLSGLHARLFAFLHAPERMRLLHLPLAPALHWRSASASHRAPIVFSLVLGLLALGFVVPERALLAEFIWFGLLALILEPATSALAASLGRRFPERSPAHEIQRSLGGGWTTPEAVIHLYAPACCVGLATLLAMPGQLSWARWIDGHAITAGHLAIGVAPAVVAIVIRALAPRVYAHGFWEAIPWLAEATKTLAGPPLPEPTPGWARRIPNPYTRLVVIEFWRTTPLPGLRLVLVLGLAAHALLRSAAPGGPTLALCGVAIAAWIVPAGTLWRGIRRRAAVCRALPLPPAQRHGKLGLAALSLLCLPCLGLVVALSFGFVR